MKLLRSCVLLLVLVIPTDSWATFSVVAVDRATGEIGSAGASCVSGQGNVIILSDVVLGLGVMHTQAHYLPSNQSNARNRLLAGDTPQQIMDWLDQNDAQGNPSKRQYLAVTLDGASASYTGSNADAVALDVNGLDYAIAGNILLEDDVVYDMEQALLNTQGTLAERLMAAMQAAKRIGADARCQPFDLSSAAAFLRVATACDVDASAGNLSTDLEVYLDGGSQSPYPEPIDELQSALDQHVAPECVTDLIFENGFE